ncbi:MAG: hypothetical protein ACJ75B_16895 [Flavisolibacter sp.]
MPDLLGVFEKRWKYIIGLTTIATLIALAAALLSPKKYLSTATALPANSLVADKARLFGDNIQALYSDLGTIDELDKFEGTGMLDTIFIATASELNLADHYQIPDQGEGLYKAAIQLKKNSSISRSGYGELKIKVWDEDRNLAADLANSLLSKIQDVQQHLLSQINTTVLQRIRQDLLEKQVAYKTINDSLGRPTGADEEIVRAKKTVLLEELERDEKMVDEYQLAIDTNPPALLTVEKARASLWPDKPKVLATVLISFFAALVFSFLMVLFMDSRKISK